MRARGTIPIDSILPLAPRLPLPLIQLFQIHLEAREKNSSVLSFYMKKSFSRVGFRKNFYGDDNAILMEKIIE